MISVTAGRFWRCFRELPASVQRQAKKNYRLFRNDPNHPSLRFKRLAGFTSLYSVRINDDYRALGYVENETVVWIWIGTHQEYDKFLKQL